MNIHNIPSTLRVLPQWVLWRTEPRSPGEKPTKIPYCLDGITRAAANDSSTWGEYERALDRYEHGDFEGIGFEFARDGGLLGIDLDACRDPKTGRVADWAREIVLMFKSYSEVSPSLTGIKIFCLGKSPFETGRKREVENAEKIIEGKTPEVEIYDRARYFTVTGMKLAGVPSEPQDATSDKLEWLKSKFFPAIKFTPQPAHVFESESAVIERARKYLAKIPPAISGSRGHDTTFYAACRIVLGFGLPGDTSLALLSEWNAGCVPPWSEKELRHKINQAQKQPGERNYLRNTEPEKWDQVKIPAYSPPPAPPKITTLVDAAQFYVDRVKANDVEIIETGLPEIDYALGGGIERGEMIIIAGLPSHGKSAVALQCVHHWTSEGRPGVIISEEMSMRMLGKRTLQFNSEIPEEHWATSIDKLQEDVDFYRKHHAICTIVESCGTIERAEQEIERAILDNKAQFAVVDYAQLLKAPGKSKYEEVSNTSRVLKNLVLRHNIFIIALCQLNRDIEKRPKFIPVLGDIKDSGQLGQDADVVVFIVWPHRIKSSNPPGEYLMFVAKNKNRAINQAALRCKFLPSRQALVTPKPTDHVNYVPEFDAFSERKDFQ